MNAEEKMNNSQFFIIFFNIIIFFGMSSIKVKLEENNPERVDDFVKKSPAAVKKVIEHFDNFEVTMQISYFP